MKDKPELGQIIHKGPLYIFGEPTLEVDFVTITDESEIPEDHPFKRVKPETDKE